MTGAGVLTLGETMGVARSSQALKLGGPLHLSVAGSEANVAIGLARLGHRARWFGRVGADELGALVLRTLRAEAVDVDDVVLDEQAPTGLMLADRTPGGHVRMHYYRRNSAAANLTPADLDASLLDGIGLVHLTGITPALGSGPAATVAHLAELARSTGTTLALDVNYRQALWTRAQARDCLVPLLAGVDILIASDDELDLVADGDTEAEQFDSVRDRGVGEVVVKRGHRGASLFLGPDRLDRDARRVTAVDTTGAGDAFTAGFLSARLDGCRPEEQLARAVTMGAYAVMATGDWENLPTRRELDVLDLHVGTTLR